MENFRSQVTALLFSCMTLFFEGNIYAQSNKDILDVYNAGRSLTAAGVGVGVTPTAMRTLPLEEEAMKGDFYLNKEYTDMVLAVIDDANYRLKAKYNIRNNVFVALKEDDELGALDGKMVEQFKYEDVEGEHYFIATQKYPFNPMEASPGFYEVLYSNNGLQLLIRYRIQIVDANYNVALDVGERSGRIEVIKRYYFYEKGTFIEIRNFKRKNLAMFGDLSGAMNNYIRNQNLQANDENDLISVVKRYDFLTAAAKGDKNSPAE